MDWSKSFLSPKRWWSCRNWWRSWKRCYWATYWKIWCLDFCKWQKRLFVFISRKFLCLRLKENGEMLMDRLSNIQNGIAFSTSEDIFLHKILKKRAFFFVFHLGTKWAEWSDRWWRLWWYVGKSIRWMEWFSLYIKCKTILRLSVLYVFSEEKIIDWLQFSWFLDQAESSGLEFTTSVQKQNFHFLGCNVCFLFFKASAKWPTFNWWELLVFQLEWVLLH